MRATVSRLPRDIAFRAANLGLIASRAAYEEGSFWLDSLIGLLDRNRHLMAELLAERIPEIGYAPPSATYLAWLDCTRLGLDGEAADVFRERGRVALGRGSDFGRQPGFVRVTLATDPSILAEIVERMRAALD
jgi:cystathionine beta-lyase